ncbi:hypothetical protein YN1HA_30850 [Sulfurisphaera ohwakuensis]
MNISIKEDIYKNVELSSMLIRLIKNMATFNIIFALCNFAYGILYKNFYVYKCILNI